jgi:hypothetical protein
MHLFFFPGKIGIEVFFKKMPFSTFIGCLQMIILLYCVRILILKFTNNYSPIRAGVRRGVDAPGVTISCLAMMASCF